MATFGDLNLLDCADCRLEVEARYIGAERPERCEHCGRKVAVYLFPALSRTQAKAAVATPVIGAESSCFYHPSKQAAIVCDDCGRFLCHLCDVEFEGRHVCAPCLENDSNKLKRSKTGIRYTYHDSVALMYAVAGLILGFFAFLLAPLALYHVFRHWNSPRSVVPRSKWRFVLAAVLAIGELAFWGIVIVLMVAGE